MLGTLKKATTVLSLFTREKAEWGVSEVARELGLPKSSTHSLLTSLAQAGMLEHTDENRYRLGWRLLTLGRSLLDGSALRTHARPTVDALRSRLDGTIHVATLDGGQITYIEKADGRRPSIPITISGVGRRAPAHCSALGKALLAHSPWSVVEEAASTSNLRRYTDNTICTLPELRSELGDIRRRGYARDTEEVVPGVWCFAAPILDTHGRAFAAISIAVRTEFGFGASEHFSRVAIGASRQITRSMRRAALDVGVPQGHAGENTSAFAEA